MGTRLYISGGSEALEACRRASDGIEVLPVSSLQEKIVLGRDESLKAVFVILPGADCTIPLTVDISGEGASAELSGVYVCDGTDKVTLDVNVSHLSGRTTSRQLFNGIASGHSRAAFHGRIVVRQDSQKIKAFQENHNILLSPDARIETQPQLEIYADDVECSHGATTGFLNADEQFYMRSRGIPEAEAKVLQMISFLSPALAAIPSQKLRETVASLVEDAVRSL